MSRIQPHEVAPGLVLYINPAIMLQLGAEVGGRPECAVRGVHRFLCLAAGDPSSWTPLFSNDGPLRVHVPARGRRGDLTWQSGNSYYHPHQIWAVPFPVLAAASALDGTRPGLRNTYHHSEEDQS